MTVEAHKETLGFQTEVRQLLDLVIHSLYSNKEVFLRELVSNASDAADKLRFEALTDDALYEGEGELQIWVSYDKEARTVTVRDNGIGMSRQEVVDHIGTIARSGTRAFFQRLTGDQAKDSQLIGQFGVGFYSAFIVADRVTLTTRRAGLGAEQGVRWESTGGGEYTLETLERAERGTEVVLHLRPDEDEFLDGWRLRSILRKFSDHIAFPIRMPKEGDPQEWEVVNQGTALWARPKAEVTEEQYREFYPHVSHDFGEPLAWTHNRVEGAIEYISLLYLPARALRYLGSARAPRREALRAPGLHHGRRRAVDAALSSVRAGGHRRPRPAPEHLPGDPPAEPPDRVDPLRLREEVARTARAFGKG